MGIAKCVFCGREQEDFKGVYLIKNEGIAVYYCSSKCRKNHIKLGRDKRRIRWTEAFHEQRKKAIAKSKVSAESAAKKN